MLTMTLVQPVYCMACREPLDPADAFCKACGFEQNQGRQRHASPMAAVTVSLPVPHPYAANGLSACPTCAGTSIQKISGIARAGAWNANTQGNFVGAVHTGGGHFQQFGGVTSSATSGTTILAGQLAPPRQPQRSFPALAFTAITLAGAALIMYIMQIQAIPLISLIISALAAPFALLRIAPERRQFQQAVDAWQRQMLTWNRLFYCSRCDCVFDPQTGQCAPPGLTNTLF